MTEPGGGAKGSCRLAEDVPGDVPGLSLAPCFPPFHGGSATGAQGPGVGISFWLEPLS